MKRRIGGLGKTILTGLGGGGKELLPNVGKLNKKFADAALEAYFKGKGYDFRIEEDEIAFGIEPTYQGDKRFLVTIRRDKQHSTIESGKAWGPWGSGVAKTTRYYRDYKYESKFVKFVNQWHPVLFPEVK